MIQSHDSRPQQESADATRLIVRARKLNLHLPEVNERAALLVEWLPRQVRPEQRLINELQEIVHQYEQTAALNPDDPQGPFRPAPGEAEGIKQGDFSICTTAETNTPVLIALHELSCGIQLCTRTGQGKSTLIAHLAREVMARGVSVFLFARKGVELFTPLARAFPGKVLIAQAGKDIFWNPLWPLSGTIEDRVSRHLPLFLCAYERHDSEMVFRLAAQHFSRQAQLSKAIAPTFADIRDAIPRIQAPEGFTISPQLKNSLFVVLTHLLHGPLGKSSNCQRGWGLKEILMSGVSLIVDTHQLEPRDEEYLVSSLLADIRELADGITGRAAIKALAIIDEASHLLSRRHGKDTSPLVDIFTLARGSQVSLAAGYHTPSTVHPLVRANSYFTIVGNLSSGSDLEAARMAAGLSYEQMRALPHLPVGQAVLKMAGRYTSPFVIKWQPVPLEQALTGEDIGKNNAEILKLLPPVVLRKESATPRPAEQPDLKHMILRDLHARPFIGVAERFADTYFGPKITWRQGKALLAGLFQEGFCCAPIRFHVNQRGQPPEFWFINKAGYEVIGNPSDQVKPCHGADYVHAFGQRWIKEALKLKGIEADIEVMRNGKAVDVSCTEPNSKLNVAIEFVLSTAANEPDQAKKDLEAGWDRVLVLCPNREILRQVQHAFALDGDIKAARICLPKDLLNTPLRTLIGEQP